MGYTTDFEGSFTCTPALNPSQVAYLKQFSETRRMKRYSAKAELLPDPVRLAVELPIGIDGEYFIGGMGSMGQDNDPSVKEHNDPPRTQPGLWCQWIPNEEGTEIEWDGNEKFYNYIEWLKYLNANFFRKWGIVLNGTVTWSGESSDDLGKITARDGLISSKKGTVSYD